MLQKIRDRLTGGYAIAFLALLAIPFVFFGINYDFTGGRYAAKVNGVEISSDRLQNEYLQQLAQFTEQGTEIPANLRPLIRRSVLSNLIRETLVSQHVAEEGYRISDQMVAEFIQGIPEFHVDGRFSRDRYYTWLQERGLSPASFEENQRNSLRLQQFQRGHAATAFVTPAEYRRYLNLYGEQRRAAVATFDVDAIAEEVEPRDEEIATYYEEHAAEFQSPESVDVRYVEIDRRDLRDRVEISDQELREYYEQVSSRYLRDERRRASHILIPFGDDEDAAEQQAAELAARVRAGEPFADLARQYSADTGTAEQGGDLGSLTRTQMPEALGDAVFSMQEGEIAGPLESEFGYHVVRLEESESGGPAPLEEVRAEVENELRDVEAEAAYEELERALSDALFEARGIEQIAESTGLEVRSASGITRQGGAPFGSNQAVIDTVFDPSLREDGMVSDIVELDANRSAVFSVEEYEEAARLPLEEVRDEIVARLSQERARGIARDRAAALQERLAEGADFRSAAAESGAQVSPMRTLGRQDSETDSRVLEAIFRAPRPRSGDDVTVGQAETREGDVAVYSVAAVIPGRPEAIPLEERDAGKLQLAQESGSADYTALVLELERRADIEIAEDALATPEF
jgi:peptidyl-prolyl cis-trans isomerase D